MKFTVQSHPLLSKFPWLVVDESGEPALWQPDPKIGRVPMGFKTQGIAQAAANRLNGQHER